MFLKKKVKIDFYVDDNPGEDEVFLKCPVCGKVYHKAECDEDGDWDLYIDGFDNDLIRIKKVKFIIFMCYECFDDREYFEEEYDENGDFPLDALCYDQYMNLVHQAECCY